MLDAPPDGRSHALHHPRLLALADRIRSGGEVSAADLDGCGLDAPLRTALASVLDACAERERERQTLKSGNEELLLAFEELAREQAAELARQNETLRIQNEVLRLANQHKSDFVTMVTHELRAPLTSVLGFSEILLEGLGGPLGEENLEYVRDIHRAGEHLLRLINDILDLAKVDAGKLEFHPMPLDLALPVREAEEMARGMALKKGVALSVELTAPAPCVADIQRLRQVTLNLISNAVKFTPQGGSVRCSVGVRDGFAELRVKDSGVGIAPEHHGLVFEPFRQLDSSTTRSQGGTGVGLALVKKFVEQMGGEVALESQRGAGATFSVRFPAQPAPSGAVEAA